MNVREITQAIIRATEVPLFPEGKTCDFLIAGDPEKEVRKIGSTFMATVDVIRRAMAEKVDLIITHEPTWFTGVDNLDWVEGDPVYEAKKKLLDESGIAVWRFHDYMHFAREDGVYRGFDRQTGWRFYRMPPLPAGLAVMPGIRFDGCYEIPETTLRGLASFLQETFHMPDIRYIGDPDMPVRRVGVLPGGGSLGLGVEQMPMLLMARRNLDVLLCGDLTEWTLPAYVRDASQLGMNKGIIVLGHERSEEPGMKYLGDWLSFYLPDVPVVFLDAGEPFQYFHQTEKEN